MLDNRNKAKHTYFDDVEAEIEDKFNHLKDQIVNFEKINAENNSLLEFREVLIKSNIMLAETQFFE